MMLYRFANEKYCTDISGEGARINGGRWNSPGIAVTYTSSFISLSLLELLIHNISYTEIKRNRLVCVETPDKSMTEINNTRLKKGWQLDIGYSRFIGNEFIKSADTLLLKVPSAIIEEEYNIIINPLHKDFSKVKITQLRDVAFDTRLFK